MNTIQNSLSFIHISWKKNMNFSTFLKGGVLLAAFFIISSEAFAQLPVRTQNLQLLGATSGNLTQNVPLVVTNYSVTWPNDNVGVALADADNAYLRATKTGLNMAMSWIEITGELVDGSGLAGQVAYWADANTLTGEPAFTYAGGALTLGTGAGAGTIVLNDGSANTATVGTGAQSTDNIFNFDAPTVGGTYVIPVSTNGATLAGQVFVSNGDGSGTWEDNPTQYLKAGSVVPGLNAYSATVIFNDPYLTLPSVTVTAAGPLANGYVLQVTAIALTGFTILSSAPFDITDTISWMANAAYNPIP